LGRLTEDKSKLMTPLVHRKILKKSLRRTVIHSSRFRALEMSRIQSVWVMVE